MCEGKEKVGVGVLGEGIDMGKRVENDWVKVTGVGEVRFMEEVGGKEISLCSFFGKG